MKCTCKDLVNNGDHYCPIHGTFAKAHEPEPTEAAPSPVENYDNAQSAFISEQVEQLAEREAVVGGQPETNSLSQQKRIHSMQGGSMKDFVPQPETPRPGDPKDMMIGGKFDVTRPEMGKATTEEIDLVDKLTALFSTADKVKILRKYRAAASGTESTPGVEDHKYLAPECSEHGCHFLFLQRGGSCAHCPQIDCPDCKGKGKTKTGAQSIPWKLCSKCKATGKIPPQPSSLTQAGPEKHEREMLEVIDQRDKWEEKIGDLAALAGCREEWSNIHEHGDCIEEAIHELRAGSNYVADDEIYPRQVNFANGRIVSIADQDGKTFLRISWTAQSQKGGGE